MNNLTSHFSDFRYFSTFANVSKDNSSSLTGTLGEGPQHLWQPWDYGKRVADARTIAKFREENPACTRAQVKEWMKEALLDPDNQKIVKKMEAI